MDIPVSFKVVCIKSTYFPTCTNNCTCISLFYLQEPLFTRMLFDCAIIISYLGARLPAEAIRVLTRRGDVASLANTFEVWYGIGLG